MEVRDLVRKPREILRRRVNPQTPYASHRMRHIEDFEVQVRPAGVGCFWWKVVRLSSGEVLADGATFGFERAFRIGGVRMRELQGLLV